MTIIDDPVTPSPEQQAKAISWFEEIMESVHKAKKQRGGSWKYFRPTQEVQPDQIVEVFNGQERN